MMPVISKQTQVKARLILRKLKCHDAIRYSGPLYIGRYFVRQDYEIRDRYDGIWESISAFIPDSYTRNTFQTLINLIEQEKPTKSFMLTPYTYRQEYKCSV